MNMKTCADMYVFPMRYRVVQKFPLLYRRLRKSWNGGFADYAAGISLCGISSYVERLCGRSSEVFRMCRYKRTPHFSRDTLCLPMLRKIGMVVDRRVPCAAILSTLRCFLHNIEGIVYRR